MKKYIFKITSVNYYTHEETSKIISYSDIITTNKKEAFKQMSLSVKKGSCLNYDTLTSFNLVSVENVAFTFGDRIR